MLEKLRDVRELWRLLQRRFGKTTAVLLLLIATSLCAYVYREKIKEFSTEIGLWSYIQNLVPVPKASEGQFTIAIARFHNDPSDSMQRAFQRELPIGTGTVALTIPHLVGREATPRTDVCHADARKLLDETKADALLWGSVIRQGQSEVPQVIWTSKTACGTSSQPLRYAFSETLTLPPIATEHLFFILRAQAEQESNALLAAHGSSTNTRDTISKLRTLLSDKVSASLSPDVRTSLQTILADLEALYVIFDSPNASAQDIENAVATQDATLNLLGESAPLRNRAVAYLHRGQLNRLRAIRDDDIELLDVAKQDLRVAYEMFVQAGDRRASLIAISELADSLIYLPLGTLYERPRMRAAVSAKERLEAAEAVGSFREIAVARIGYCSAHSDLHISRKAVARLVELIEKCTQWAENPAMQPDLQFQLRIVVGDGWIYRKAWFAQDLPSTVIKSIGEWRDMAETQRAFWAKRAFEQQILYLLIEFSLDNNDPRFISRIIEIANSMSLDLSATTNPIIEARRRRLIADAFALEATLGNFSDEAVTCKAARNLYSQVFESRWRQHMYPSRHSRFAIGGKCGLQRRADDLS